MTATTMALSLDSLFSQQKEIDTLRNVLLKLKDANGSLDTTPTGLWLGDTVQRSNYAFRQTPIIYSQLTFIFYTD